MPTHPVVATRNDDDLGPEPTLEIRCPACGSPAFLFPKVLDDEKPVTCAECGGFVSTYGELRQRCDTC
jgi:hypothetical protein